MVRELLRTIFLNSPVATPICSIVNLVAARSVLFFDIEVIWVDRGISRDVTRSRVCLVTPLIRHFGGQASAVVSAACALQCTMYVLFIYIYNSVLTRRHIHINSSASTPPNATKIAEMKDSHHGQVIVGPELLFSIYKCCFLEFGSDAKRMRAELTLAQSTDLPDGGGAI